MGKFISKLSALSQKGWVYYVAPLVALLLFWASMLLSGKISNVEGYYLIHYLYDYSHGFVARGFVGEIITLFTDTVTDRITFFIINLSSVLLAVGASLCIGKALNKVKGDRSRFLWVLGLVLLMCILPFSFRAYYPDFKLDKILWMLTLFAVFLADNKIGIYLTPILCIIATLVNPVFLFCSMILIALIMLQRFYESGYKVKYAIICFTAYAAMIAIALYGTLNESKLGFKTPTELVEYYFAKYEHGVPEYLDRFEEEWLFDYFEPLKRIFELAYEIYFKSWGNGQVVFFHLIFNALPTYAVFTVFWLKTIKAEKNKFQKFIFVLCMISPLALIPPISISWESSKYFGNNTIVQLCLIVYYIAHNNPSVMSTVKKAQKWIGDNLVLTSMIAVYFVALIW